MASSWCSSAGGRCAAMAIPIVRAFRSSHLLWRFPQIKRAMAFSIVRAHCGPLGGRGTPTFLHFKPDATLPW
eukprot:4947411-Prymnesium_polylepis.1